MGEPTPFITMDSGNTTGKSFSGTGTSPHEWHLIIGIGHPQ